MSFQTLASRSRTFTPMMQQVRYLTPFGQVETKAFKWSGMKKHPGVFPLVAIMGVAVVGVVGFSIYSANTRENVVFRKERPTYSESMDLLNPSKLKLRVINQQYNALPEVDALYKDMYGKTEE